MPQLENDPSTLARERTPIGGPGHPREYCKESPRPPPARAPYDPAMLAKLMSFLLLGIVRFLTGSQVRW